jgi:hypothetical protein
VSERAVDAGDEDSAVGDEVVDEDDNNEQERSAGNEGNFPGTDILLGNDRCWHLGSFLLSPSPSTTLLEACLLACCYCNIVLIVRLWCIAVHHHYHHLITDMGMAC